MALNNVMNITLPNRQVVFMGPTIDFRTNFEMLESQLLQTKFEGRATEHNSSAKQCYESGSSLATDKVKRPKTIGIYE